MFNPSLSSSAVLCRGSDLTFFFFPSYSSRSTQSGSRIRKERKTRIGIWTSIGNRRRKKTRPRSWNGFGSSSCKMGENELEFTTPASSSFDGFLFCCFCPWTAPVRHLYRPSSCSCQVTRVPCKRKKPVNRKLDGVRDQESRHPPTELDLLMRRSSVWRQLGVVPFPSSISPTIYASVIQV